MGVTRTGNRRFRARYSVNGVRYNVGTFKSQKAAHEAMAKHMWDNKHYPGFLEIKPEPAKYNPSKPTLIERLKNAINNYRANSE